MRRDNWHCAGRSTTACTCRFSMSIRHRTGTNSARRFRNSMLPDRTSSMPMSTVTSVTRQPGTFRFAPPAMAVFRSAAPTTPTNGPVTFLSTSCPASTILRRASSPQRTDASPQMAIPIPSVLRGKHRGGRLGFIMCWNLDENSQPRTCWRSRMMFSRKTICLQQNALYTPSTTRQSPRHGQSKPLT